jgi:hypothetical protein
MTQNRMFANASLRPSGSTVTHGMAEVLQTIFTSANAAERTFDRTITGRNNAALAADSEPMF